MKPGAAVSGAQVRQGGFLNCRKSALVGVGPNCLLPLRLIAATGECNNLMAWNVHMKKMKMNRKMMLPLRASASASAVSFGDVAVCN